MNGRLSTLELSALSRIMDELDYYQLLEIERSASPAEVKRAYYAGARAFHPDALRGSSGASNRAYEQISKRVTEAYCVLRDPRQRAAYDDQLGESGPVRIQLPAARTASKHVSQVTRQGDTPQGREFFQRALQDADQGNLDAALQKMQIALTFEPQNAGFAAQRDEWRDFT